VSHDVADHRVRVAAFRRFKDQLHEEHPGLLPAWYAFRDARLRGNALCRISQTASAETPASSADPIRATSGSPGGVAHAMAAARNVKR
jgi:hypothetical protein